MMKFACLILLLTVVLQVQALTIDWHDFPVRPLKKRGDPNHSEAGLSSSETAKNNKPKLLPDLNTPPPSDSSDEDLSDKRHSSTTSSINQTETHSNLPPKSVKELPGWRVKYNEKRRQNRERFRTNDLIGYKDSLKKEYQTRKESMKAKQAIWEQNPTLQDSRYSPFVSKRTQIRKFIREGKGTEEEKDYIKSINARDAKNKKLKRVAEKKKLRLLK